MPGDGDLRAVHVPSMLVRDHRRDLVGRVLDDGLRHDGEAGVVDPQVDAAELGDGLVPELLHGGEVGDVGGDADDPAAGFSASSAVAASLTWRSFGR